MRGERKENMSVNAVNNTQTGSVYDNYEKGGASRSEEKSSVKKEEQGVLYEKNKTADKKATYSVNKMSSEERAALVKQLKADQASRQQQLVSLVHSMLNKQTQTYANAGNDSIWRTLASGNFTVDAATKAQAQSDIAEDGYWGVNQTSDRIISFATALTGGDPDKIEEMRAAFQKGYEKAEKTWGGSLPDISRKTYDAVMQKFDDLAAQAVEG